MKLWNHPILNLGYFVHTHNYNAVVVRPVEFMIASSWKLNFIAAGITESSTFVFIIMGPISPPKIVPDLSLYIYTVYTSWTSAKSSRISSFYHTNFPEKCPTFFYRWDGTSGGWLWPQGIWDLAPFLNPFMILFHKNVTCNTLLGPHFLN